MSIESIRQGFVNFRKTVSDGCARVWKWVTEGCHHLWEKITSRSQVPETKKHTTEMTKEKSFESVHVFDLPSAKKDEKQKNSDHLSHSSGTVLIYGSPDQRGVVSNANQSLQEDNVEKKVHKENESIEEKQKESASGSENDEEIIDVDELERKEHAEYEQIVAKEHDVEIVD